MGKTDSQQNHTNRAGENFALYGKVFDICVSNFVLLINFFVFDNLILWLQLKCFFTRNIASRYNFPDSVNKNRY